MESKDDKGDITPTFFPLHECTQEDFNDFYPLKESLKDSYETMTAIN